jgi:hypothetical protein
MYEAVKEKVKEEEEERISDGVSVGNREEKNPGARILNGIKWILFLPFKLLFKLISNYPKVFIVLFLILVAIGATIFLIRAKPELFGISTKQEIVGSPSEITKLLDEVGKIIELPTGEMPTIATVSDVEKVKIQPFFAKAQNGDKVIIYSASKKAILYRPSEKKIIEVGLVNINNQAQQVENGNKLNTETSTPVKKIITPTPKVVPTNRSEIPTEVPSENP